MFIGATTELHEGREIRLDIKTADGGTRQIGCDWQIQDERGREFHIVGEPVLTNLIVRFNRTWLKDGIARFRGGIASATR